MRLQSSVWPTRCSGSCRSSAIVSVNATTISSSSSEAPYIYIYIYIVKIGRDFGLGRKMAGFIYLFINYLDQRTIFEESLKRLCFETLNSKTLMELNKKTEWNEIKIRWLNWILGKITKSNLWFSQIFNYTQGKEPYISLRGVVTNSSWGSNFKIQMNPLVWLKKLYA